MPLYLVEEYLPGMSRARAAAQPRPARGMRSRKLTAPGESIRYVGTTFVPDQETGFSQFEAGSRDLVEQCVQPARDPVRAHLGGADPRCTEKEGA